MVQLRRQYIRIWQPDKDLQNYRDIHAEIREILSFLNLQPNQTVLEIGTGTGEFALVAARHCSKVYAVDAAAFARHASLAWSKVVADAAETFGAGVVLLSATQMGKDIAPRIAVALAGGLASDCTALRVEGGDIIATRPVFAGKAFIEMRITTPVKIITCNVSQGPSQAPTAASSFKSPAPMPPIA